MSRIKVAVVAGGDSSEYQISILGARFIMENLDKAKYEPYMVVVTKQLWYAEYNTQQIAIDKNDFSFLIDGAASRFDVAYVNIHGTPGENGILQSYFELIGLPYTSCGVDSSVITFNKMVCKRVVDSVGVTTAKDVIITKGDKIDAQSITSKLGLPIFIKPNASGSSFGVSKVNEASEIQHAIEIALKESDTVIIEEYIAGREFGQGLFMIDGEIITLPLTEIISKTEFFDYQAKYEGLSNEITPAEIETEMSDAMKEIAKRIYKVTNSSGVVRIDFIVKDRVPYMIELNSTPGMSQASIIPQQVRAFGKSLSWFYDQIITETLNKYKS